MTEINTNCHTEPVEMQDRNTKEGLPTETNVKVGYKKTKLGWIPEDWEILEFEEFAEKSKAAYSNKKDSENYKCVELEHINQETGSINGWTDSITQKSTKTRFATGQVLFGKLRPYLRKFWKADFNGVCSTEIWVIDGKQTKSKNNFLFYLIQSNRFIQAANATSGSKMPRADWWYVSKFPFIIPPLPEQQKIAKILSTWDKAIATQEKLITEKQTLKKGLMQHLLTGKKRFPGFEGDWEEVKLEELAEVKRGAGSQYITYVDKDDEKAIRLIRITDFLRDDPKFILKTEATNRFLLEEGDLLIAGTGATAGISFEVPGDFEGLVFSYNAPRIRVNNKVKKEFLIYYLKSNMILRQQLALFTGNAQPFLDTKAIRRFKIMLPSIKEQIRIAETLSNFDKDIKNITNHKNALILQKQGLMQQLLTGKKRVEI